MFVHRLKLQAPLPLPTWIERPMAARNLGVDGGVYSIVAGPGYGKTVLAAQRFDAWSGPKLWYSLDLADADLAVFAAHFDVLLRSISPGVAVVGEAWRLGSAKEVGGIFAESLATLDVPSLLVFDDVHVLEQSRSLAVLGELIERASAGGSTSILCGRSMPIPLHALAAGGRLTRITAADLAFDEEESRAYLERTVPPSSDRVALERLVQRAEGWPAGLALVASTSVVTFRAAAATPSDDDDETRRLLFEYLASEVLRGLNSRERSFLLETSILDSLDVELCDAVTQADDASALLRSFTRRGLFITRRSDDAYGAHQLFREFLRDELDRAYARADIAALHSRAAAVLSRRDDHVDSIAHLLQADDRESAVGALEAAAFSMLANGLLSRVGAFLDRIEVARIEASPTLLTARGRLQQLRGQWDSALGSLERAMHGAREQRQWDVLAEAVRVSGPILASRGEFEKLDELLVQTLELPLSEGARTSLRMTQGAVFLEMARDDDALALFGEILPSTVLRGDVALQGVILHNTAVAHVRRGDPYASLPVFERALGVKRSAGQRVSALMTLSNQIFVTRLLGDLDGAERLVHTLLEDARDVGNGTMLAHGYENAGSILVLRGDGAGALTAFSEAQSACDPSDVLLMPEILHGRAQALLLASDAREADEACAKAIATMRAAKRSQSIAPVLVTRAAAAFARDEYSRAAGLVREALELADEGADAVMCASVNLDAAALLVRMMPKVSEAERSELDRLAAKASGTAVGLLHQRDYRFLLRTKSEAFAMLREPMRRWKIGRGLMPEVASENVPGLRIDMLGGLRVTVGATVLAPDVWKRRKARDVFAYLVTARGRLVPRARLVDLFWPDMEADAAHDTLRVTVSAIRRAVGDVVKCENNAYRFAAPTATVVDTEVFEAAIDAARTARVEGAADRARREFSAAIEVYRGDFMDGFEDGSWQWRERERLRAAFLEALRWLAHDAEGDAAGRRAAIDRLLETTPFDVDAIKLRLELMAASQQLSEVRRAHEEWKTRYRAAVGPDPPEVWTSR
jgi:ATP/maltotriose-dependent transcriptional regulator MalT/DNA-binding SARP family transcriptional activator